MEAVITIKKLLGSGHRRTLRMIDLCPRFSGKVTFNFLVFDPSNVQCQTPFFGSLCVFIELIAHRSRRLPECVEF